MSFATRILRMSVYLSSPHRDVVVVTQSQRGIALAGCEWNINIKYINISTRNRETFYASDDIQCGTVTVALPKNS